MSLPEPEPSAAAESLYREYTRLRTGPAPIDFEAFCRQHAEHAVDLRHLHAADESAGARSPLEALNQLADHSESHAPKDPGRSDPGDPKKSRYRLDGEIGRGGMGAILKVWDNDLNRTLAMKVILGEEEIRVPDGSTAELRLGRFLEEAQITGQLDHPGVVPVHELGVDKGGRVYFTMRLVKGRHLGEIIDMARTGEDGWNQTRALTVLHRVCETMAYAHAKGVVHRDLKPENIMVGQFGETYAMDWGVARVLGKPDGEAARRRLMATSVASFVQLNRKGDAADPGSATNTQEGSIVGTPYYMPPEQAAGELETIGPPSDIYAIGAILYHLLTGKRPYEQVGQASIFHVIRAVFEGPPIAVNRLEPKVPPELVAICERAMKRQPKDRYPSMVDMAADLQAYLENRVVHAYQHGAIAEFLKWVRRNRGFSAALAALGFVVLTGLIALLWIQSEKAIAIEAAEKIARGARDQALVNLGQARRQGYLANVTAASASLAAGETLEARLHLMNCVPAASDAPDLRKWEWYHLSLAADASVAVLNPNAGSIDNLALNAAGTHLVASANDGSLWLWDLAANGAAVLLAKGSDVAGQLRAPKVAFVDSGQQAIAFGRGNDAKIRTWNAASGQLASQLGLHVRALYAIAVTRRGDLAAMGASDNSIHLIDPRSGIEPGAPLIGHRDTLRALAFSADGTLLASGSEDRTVRIWRLADRSLVGEPINVGQAVHAVAFAPGSNQLAVGLENGVVLRFAGPAFAPLDQLAGHRGAVFGLDFNGDGTRLASASFDKTVRVWNTADGGAIAELIGHEQPVHCVRFAESVSALASGSSDGSIRLWDVDRNRAVISYRGPDDYLAAVDISPDGTRVLIGSSLSGAIEMIDVATGARTAVPGPEDAVVALAFAPDGAQFAVAFRDETSVRIGDVATASLGEPMYHEASVTSIAWSKDGATIASADDRNVRFWMPARGQSASEPWTYEHAVAAIALSVDGLQLAASTVDGTIHVRETGTGKATRTLAGDGAQVLALAFGPEGQLAGGYSDGTVRVFGPGAASPSMTLIGHEQRISSLRFLPDGTRLVSGSYDFTVRVWDTANKRLALTLRDHNGPVTGVAVSGTGERIVSTAFDGTIQIRNTKRVQR